MKNKSHNISKQSSSPFTNPRVSYISDRQLAYICRQTSMKRRRPQDQKQGTAPYAYTHEILNCNFSTRYIIYNGEALLAKCNICNIYSRVKWLT